MNAMPLKVVFAALMLAVSGGIYFSSDMLPDRVASHFGFAGNADGFMSRDEYRWLMMGVVVLIPLMIVSLMSLLPRRVPMFLNIPNRDYWLAPDRREGTFVFLTQHALLLGCLMVLFWAGMHGLVVAANAKNPPHLSQGPLLALIGVEVILVLVWVIGLIRRFRKVS